MGKTKVIELTKEQREELEKCFIEKARRIVFGNVSDDFIEERKTDVSGSV